MENASKFLLIAGGVIIGVMILSLLVYVHGTISKVQVNEMSEEEIEQLQLFNQQFESYNKPSMYGTDVITVINKAIDNNRKYDYEDRIYDVDVKFKLISNVEASATRYFTNPISGRINEEYITSGTVTDNYTIYNLGIILQGNKTYKLTDTSSDRLNDDIVNLMSKNFEAKKINVNSKNKNEYTLVTSGFSDFKSRYFKCTKIDYSDVTGRVNYMEFEELNLTNRNY